MSGKRKEECEKGEGAWGVSEGLRTTLNGTFERTQELLGCVEEELKRPVVNTGEPGS